MKIYYQNLSYYYVFKVLKLFVLINNLKRIFLTYTMRNQEFSSLLEDVKSS